jgi:hypothetical protein
MQIPPGGYVFQSQAFVLGWTNASYTKKDKTKKRACCVASSMHPLFFCLFSCNPRFSWFNSLGVKVCAAGSPRRFFMAELKTKQTAVSVESFLDGVADVKRREDALRLLEIMREITGETPRMWGPTIVGFGEHHYVYASGHEGDTCQTGFSPRKDALTVYGLLGSEQSEALLPKLGKVKAGCGSDRTERHDPRRAGTPGEDAGKPAEASSCEDSAQKEMNRETHRSHEKRPHNVQRNKPISVLL